MHPIRNLSSLIALAALAAVAPAQEIVYDGFGNVPLANLHGSGGGSGWASAWAMAGENVTGVQGPGLVWPGLATTPGAAVTPVAGGIWPSSVYQRLLPAGPADAPVYVSFLLRWDELWGMWGGLSFGSYPFEMTVGSPLGYYTYGLMLSEGLGDVSHKPLLVGETTLVVLRISKNTPPAAGVSYRMYLDPAIGQSEPGFPDAMMSVGPVVSLPSFLSIDNGTGFTTDEIRVGTTWASVLPATAWGNLGFAKAGVAGLPALSAQGLLAPASPNRLDLTHAAPGGLATLVFGLVTLDAPFKGGTMVPLPQLFALMPVSGSGAASLAFKLPPGVPSGTGMVFQCWIQDVAATHGLAASNGLVGLTP